MTDEISPNIELVLPNIAVYDEAFLRSSIHKRMQLLHCDGLENYQKELVQNEEERALFQKSLQVSYSEFFRNSLSFAVLEKMVIPELIQNAIRNNRSKIRIWSMACASGQEPYSLAMLLEEYMEKLDKPFPYQLFATDQSASEIHFASKGCYDAASLSNISLKRLDRWFVREKDGYKVKEALCKHIHFSVFDVVSNPNSCPPESIFGDFDLIICANLLFYYNKDSQKIILDKAETSLSNRGYLLTGEVERNILRNRMFKEAYPYAAIFQKMP